MTITVKYSCDACGLENVTCDVPARAATHDAKAWMDRTIRFVRADHNRRSPDCHPQTLSTLQIPMTGSHRLGGPSVQ